LAGGNYKPVFVPLRAIAIRLGRALLHGSSNLPGSCNGAGRSSSPIWSCSAWGLPCQLDYSGRGALLPHHFTLTVPAFCRPARRYIFCGTFRKDPFERSPPAVSRHVALWRPDFPLACASGYPSRTCQCSVSHGLAVRGGTPVGRVASIARSAARRIDAGNAGHWRGDATKLGTGVDFRVYFSLRLARGPNPARAASREFHHGLLGCQREYPDADYRGGVREIA
jgi:hypothetical protein